MQRLAILEPRRARVFVPEREQVWEQQPCSTRTVHFMSRMFDQQAQIILDGASEPMI